MQTVHLVPWGAALLLLAMPIHPPQLIAETLRVPDDHDTIQGAIDAAETGDLILVGPGTYVETIDLSGKAITIRGAGGSAASIVDGGGGGSATVTIDSGEGAGTVLDRLTITGGAPGIAISGSSPTIRRCTIAANRGDGGLYAADSSVSVEDCTISDNSAVVGGGLYAAGIGSIDVLRCTFSDNSSTILGGGMFFDDTDFLVEDCVFEGNHAGFGGGAGAAEQKTTGKGTISRCTVAGNSSDYGGGFLLFGTFAVVSTEFSQNIADDSGGALVCHVETTVERCVFRGNDAAEYGGAAYCSGGSLRFLHSTFVGNTSPEGGAISLIEGAAPLNLTDLTLSHCILWDNGPIEEAVIVEGSNQTLTVGYSDLEGG